MSDCKGDSAFVAVCYAMFAAVLLASWIASIDARVRKLEAVSEAGGEVAE